MTDSNSYEAREMDWRLHTRAGNQQMQEQSYAQAQQSYSRALALAELMLAKAISSLNHPDAIHPYVVSHNNLIDLYLTLGEIQQAEALLQAVYTEVITVMNDKNNSKELRLESFKALKVITFEINRFYRTLNQIEQAEARFTEATQIAQAFLAQFDFTSLEDLQTDDSAQLRHSPPD
jgi:tetratricopeptide (TPR) repeat protein